MPPGPLIVAVLLVLTSVAGSLLLAGSSEVSAATSVVVAIVLITAAVIAAGGLLLARGRWARWLAVAIAMAWIALAALADAGAVLFAVAGGVVVVVALGVGPGAQGWLRAGPSPHGPPPASVVLMLSALAFPALVVMADRHEPAPLAIAGGAAVVVGAAVYSRGGIGGVWAMRALVSAGVFVATIATPLPPSLAVGAGGVTVVVLAWLPTIRAAAAPLTPLPGPGYRIPPELAPKEILDAAGLDDRGRRT